MDEEFVRGVDQADESRHRLRGEGGSAALYGLGGLILIYYFVVEGHQLLGQYDIPVLYWTVITTLSLLSFFAMGCAIHTKAIGGKSTRRIYRETKDLVQTYRALIQNSITKMREVEPTMLAHQGVIGRKGVDCLSSAKKIIRALEARLDEVSTLLRTRHKSDVLEACELMHKPLIVRESCFESLIDSDPIPALEPEDWAPALGRLFSTINIELQKIAENTGRSPRGKRKEHEVAAPVARKVAAAKG